MKGTLVSLNISSNNLGFDGAKHVAAALKVNVRQICLQEFCTRCGGSGTRKGSSICFHLIYIICTGQGGADEPQSCKQQPL
jgi:hypothetical protein